MKLEKGGLRLFRLFGIEVYVHWLWAVVAQRSHRMRAGNVFHDAFRGILTDPHAALASNRDRSADIRALRAMAEEHVATVADTQNIEAS